MSALLAEVELLGGKTRRTLEVDLGRALEELVRNEGITSAAVWQTPDFKVMRVTELLRRLGVEVVPPEAGYRALAGCQLGVTGADYALPETGTLVLLGSSDRPRAVSLLPPIHLALVRPEALRTNMEAVFSEIGPQRYFVFVTGPSRTADIELTVTIGVHGPQSLHVWSLDG
jgi:L-lactate dehydrogenase complex protein LldG